MSLKFKTIGNSENLVNEAAEILTKTFTGLGKPVWKDLGSAKKEVIECIGDPNICIGIFSHRDELLGWVGLRPLYEKTWEMHPLVVKKSHQKKGLGRKLVNEIERMAKKQGINGILLGTDDETSATTLSQKNIEGSNVLKEIENIKNLKNHPYGFYQRCGYAIIGVVPDANGPGKPDIWMWKRLQ